MEDAALALGKNGETAIDELDVDPVDEKRCFSELDDGTETHLGKAPTAPGVNAEKYDQKDAAAHQEKVGAGVPVVVDGVQMDGGSVELDGKPTRQNTCGPEGGKDGAFVAFGNVGEEEEADGQASEREGCPGKKWEQPGLRVAVNVDAVDVGLEGPRERARAMSGPQ